MLGSGLLPVGSVEFCQVATGIGLDRFHPSLALGLREIAVAVFDRLEFAAINRNERIRKQVQLPAQYDELSADDTDGRAVSLRKLAALRQPHQFNIALRA